jgi:dihydrolipoamide dehydrogenase
MYDLTVIGAGWAGFNACLKARQMGKKVCLIERSELGGTCLNTGCIPTKSFVHSARTYHQTRKAASFGVTVLESSFDIHKAQERKSKIIQVLKNGIQSQLAGIDYINAAARFLNPQEIQAGDKTVKTQFVLVATGSCPAELDFLKFDGKKIISSNELLELKTVPKSFLIIGAGAIGCEFASIYSHLGTQVTLAEKMPQILPGGDAEVARKIETSFKKRGIKVITSADAKSLAAGDFDLVLVAVGRKPCFDGMRLEDIGIVTEKGKIKTDEYLKTSIDTVYAAGDCTASLMLAHFASYQGILAVENMFSQGNKTRSNYDAVASAVFSDPETASVGLTQERALEDGHLIRRFDFRASGMAHIIDETDGFIKIISEKNTEKIVGAHIVGAKASELISVFSVAVSSGLTISHLKNSIFTHPSLSEAIGECARK